MKILKKVIWLLLIVLVIAQFFGPEKNKGEIASIDAFLKDTKPPNEVQYILKVGCYDCHSDFTKYPWYSSITPVNYWMANHIDHGKKHFNVSKWNDYSVGKKLDKIDELIELVEKREMPIPSYTWGHSEAKLNDEQIKAVVSWAKNVQLKYNLLPKPE